MNGPVTSANKLKWDPSITNPLYMEMVDLLRCHQCKKLNYSVHNLSKCDHVVCGDCKVGMSARKCPVCKLPAMEIKRDSDYESLIKDVRLLNQQYLKISFAADKNTNKGPRSDKITSSPRPVMEAVISPVKKVDNAAKGFELRQDLSHLTEASVCTQDLSIDQDKLDDASDTEAIGSVDKRKGRGKAQEKTIPMKRQKPASDSTEKQTNAISDDKNKRKGKNKEREGEKEAERLKEKEKEKERLQTRSTSSRSNASKNIVMKAVISPVKKVDNAAKGFELSQDLSHLNEASVCTKDLSIDQDKLDDASDTEAIGSVNKRKGRGKAQEKTIPMKRQKLASDSTEKQTNAISDDKNKRRDKDKEREGEKEKERLQTRSTSNRSNASKNTKSRILIASTLLTPDQKKILEKFKSSLGIRITPDFPSNVTHLVTKSDSQKRAVRSLKYMKALLTHKWIVSFDWVTESLKAGELLSEEPYELQGTTKQPERSLGAPKFSRTSKKKLFSGINFYFDGKFKSPDLPNLEELRDIVATGGGTIFDGSLRLNSALRKNKRVIIVKDKVKVDDESTGSGKHIETAVLLAVVTAYKTDELFN